MRELLLHSGLHKTGTTYLQHMLLANRAHLAAAGLTPAPFLNPIEGNHLPLIRALHAGGYAPAAFAQAFDAIAAAPGDRLIITAEELSTLVLQHPDRSEALRDAALARGLRPRILICLRRQDHLQESIFGQATRSWYHGDIRDFSTYRLDHDARLRAIEAVFGQENVRVMLYRDEGPNDLLAGFLAALGIPLDRAALAPVPPRNRTAHRRQVLFMSQLPKSPRARNDRAHMAFNMRVARILRASGAVADDGGRDLLSPRERHDLVARHLEGNRALAARYGIDGAGSFLELPDPDAPWTPPAPISAAERRAAFRAVLRGFWGRRNWAAALADSTRAGLVFARMPRS